MSPPVLTQTNEMDLKELFAEHATDIAEVLSTTRRYIASNKELEQVLNENFVLDELCALKYLLSAPKRVSKTTPTLALAASAALQETLHVRLESAQLLRDAVDRTKFRFPEDAYVGMSMGGLAGGNLLVMVSHIGQTDLREVAKRFNGSVQEIANNGKMAGENMRLLVDAKSRATGKLCKLISIVDLEGVSLMRLNSPKVLQAMGVISKHNEQHAPQFLSGAIIINPPSIFSMLFALVKPFLSASTLEKLGYCGKKRMQTDITACPFVSKLNARDQIPERAGGTFRVASSE